MATNGERESPQSTEEAMLAHQIAKALMAENIDEAFRVMGRFMDKRRYQVSPDVMNEFKVAGRIRETDIY